MEARISSLKAAVGEIRADLKAIRRDLAEMKGKLSNVPTMFQLVFMQASLFAIFAGVFGLLITRWVPSGGLPPLRTFYYSANWWNSLLRLPGSNARGQLVRPASPRARVQGLVERFVVGDPKATLVRPRGDGMDPVFKRLRHPNAAVVEMRTYATRSFGFFSRVNTYVALYLEQTDEIKIKLRAGKSPYEECADNVLRILRRIVDADIDRTTDVEELVADPY